MPNTHTPIRSRGGADISAAPETTGGRLLPRSAAVVAAVFLLGNAALWMVATENMGDHATVAGRASEALVGASFVFGAVALLFIARRAGSALGLWRVAWWLAVVAMIAAGVTMIAVFVSATEPPFELFLAEAGLAAASLIAVGISGWRAQAFPLWVGIGVALLLPMMFLLPLNSLWMAAVWVAVAITATTGDFGGRGFAKLQP
ncbi:hypothetical protein [Homoserinimonas sp. OAct 916]|uniref:hypothetical protein n=1 Tax=Homoserinimonas sp. OAct 916 TaxID=2211450 RepID=UPI000DBE0691|nr:hypothetical protein [Homoserinimonas sp. OAct 916]